MPASVADVRLGVGPVILGGNSLGGEIAWQVALAEPARVAGLVLVDAAGFAFEPESLPLGFRIARIPVANLTAAAGDDDLNRGRRKLVLRFELPRGAYATMLVKRLTTPG